MAGVGEGVSAKGLWGRSSKWHGQGRNFRRSNPDALARFADALAEHIDEADIAAGRNLETGKPLAPSQEPDPGGNTRLCAQRIGIRPHQGNAMLQRIRKRLGPQAV